MTGKHFAGGAVLALAVLTGAGCAKDAVNKDRQDSFLTGNDAQIMTDSMATKMASDPKVVKLTENGPIVIVLDQIRNDTNEIIRPDTKWMFCNRISVLLSRHSELDRRFKFVINRSDYESIQAHEGLVKPADVAEPEGRLQPQYVLTGTFSALTNDSKKSRTDYYLCTFRLTRIGGQNTGEVIWMDAYETQKSVVKGFLD